MNNLETMTELVIILNNNHFAALVLLMLVWITRGHPPKA